MRLCLCAGLTRLSRWRRRRSGILSAQEATAQAAASPPGIRRWTRPCRPRRTRRRRTPGTATSNGSAQCAKRWRIGTACSPSGTGCAFATTWAPGAAMLWMSLASRGASGCIPCGRGKSRPWARRLASGGLGISARWRPAGSLLCTSPTTSRRGRRSKRSPGFRPSCRPRSIPRLLRRPTLQMGGALGSGTHRAVSGPCAPCPIWPSRLPPGRRGRTARQ